MDQALVQLLADLHKAGERQGPGGEAETRLALRLAGLDGSRPLKIADIGWRGKLDDPAREGTRRPDHRRGFPAGIP